MSFRLTFYLPTLVANVSSVSFRLAFYLPTLVANVSTLQPAAGTSLSAVHNRTQFSYLRYTIGSEEVDRPPQWSGNLVLNTPNKCGEKVLGTPSTMESAGNKHTTFYSA